jgi:hypothetical protein
MTEGIVWVCGRHIEKTSNGRVAWELRGIFDNESATIDCARTLHDFIGLVSVGETFPDAQQDWPKCHYPQRDELCGQ